MKPTLFTLLLFCTFISSIAFAQPSNNNFADAINLTLSTSSSCSGKIAGTLVNATRSAEGGTTPSCTVKPIIGDVWYKVNVPASGNFSVKIDNTGVSNAFPVVSLYSGSSGNLTEVSCNYNREGGPSIIRLKGESSTTLYIRVWSIDKLDTFDICVWEPQNFPTNDDPTGATTLVVSSGSCSVKTAASTLKATNSGETQPAADCGYALDSDVWYKAVVPDSGNLTVTTYDVPNGRFDSVLLAYTGSPGNLTELHCNDDFNSNTLLSKIILTNQPKGDTIYFRVSGNTGLRSLFEICATEPQNPPTNSYASEAIPLTVGSGSCSGNELVGSTVEASTSKVADPNCGRDLDSDVWYKAVVPISKSLTIETSPEVSGNDFDTVLTAYSGTPTSLTEVGCVDDAGASGGFSKLTLTGQNSGTTLYVRVWGYDGERNSFKICAWDPMPLSKVDIAQQTFEVYPNPTKGELHIEGQYTINSVVIYNLVGAKVLSTDLANNNAELDVSSLSTGIYLTHIMHEQGSGFVKFVKE